MSEVYYSSIFSELTKQVQARIDAASELAQALVRPKCLRAFFGVGYSHGRVQFRRDHRIV